MLLYEERKFTLQELIVYLNDLNNKSVVLDLKYGEHDIEVVYGIDSNNVQTLVVREDEDIDAGLDFLNYYCSYSNIDEEVFTAKVCGWKEISYLELLYIILKEEPDELAFQMDKADNGNDMDKELFMVESMEALAQVMHKFKEIYYDDEVVFFKAIE